MKYNNGELTLGVGTCWCKTGKVFARLMCDVCKGTGDGPKGGRRGCKHCNGYGTRVHSKIKVDCSECGGTAKVPENWYSRIPRDAAAALAENVVVVRNDDVWSPNHKNVPQIFNVLDYGASWHRTDAENAEIVAQHIREQDIQACHVVQEPYYERDDKTTLKIADGVLVEIERYGYVVKPLFYGRVEKGMVWAS